MLFNTGQFLIFFPVVVLAFFVIPRKARQLWLLAASYFFYMCWSAKYGLLLLFATLITYLAGRVLAAIPAEQKNARKAALFAGIFIPMLVLFFFKYLDFAFKNLNTVLNLLGIESVSAPFSLVLPVGISFFTFQAAGYVIDVYRGDTPAEKSFLRYALFVSFFPQLVAGPIERSKNLLSQLQNLEDITFDPENIRYGLLTMALGLAQKMILADRLGSIVDPVFENWQTSSGAQLAVATMLFSLQIYCDFGGYSQIAIGAARVLGIRLMENFQAPYLALNIKDFWRRWHRSLTTWFTDYVYIPLGGNRRGRTRKYINTLFVFLLSGLWHGADWSFVFWGGLNGVYLVLQDITDTGRKALYQKLGIRTEGAPFRLLCRVVVFVMASFGWLFFRASGLRQAAGILLRIVSDCNPLTLLSPGVFNLFSSTQTFAVLAAAVIIMFLLDGITDRKGDCRAVILQQETWVRWIIYLSLIVVILLFGVYGESYVQTQFIYFQF